ncbi:GGDEF domain-containing protein [Filobacillus milosensis]|uniref:GGDEF domain-containing protein n=1 Tax=Filobacillus milosensis TaxID=94137 RepID=A0A4Y8IC64_9BACI|nr:GGDEF domain-containing protein [Filobacillus milosensis]TFB13566.1 GGDEF domain-containing protein [Filobacillus milosensis]
MFLLLNDLFINLCVLISLIFIYLQVRWKFFKLEGKRKIYIILDGLAGGVLGYILMNFSIQVTTETIVDLRFIPVMLILMFVGIPQAIISAFLIIIGRFVFGVTTSAVAAMISMSILIIGFILIHKLFKKNNLALNSYKQGLVMIIFSSIVFSIIISFLVKDVGILISLLPPYWIISIIGGLTAVFFVEYIRKTQYLILRYEKESKTDFLTGLNNVRQFDVIWNSLISNANDKKERLSLLIIDIDYFKNINDTFGHPIGDKILIEFGKILKSTTRSIDFVSRNGGEEFSVILPDCPHHQAIEIAERIRETVEIHQFHVSSEQTINLTISIGVATYPDTVSDMNQVVGTADEGLYKAKWAGRNRVCANYSE